MKSEAEKYCDVFVWLTEGGDPIALPLLVLEHEWRDAFKPRTQDHPEAHPEINREKIAA